MLVIRKQLKSIVLKQYVSVVLYRKMKKAIYLVTMLFITNCFYAQSGQAEYIIKMNALSYPNAGKYEERIEKMKEYANNQKFELIFNKSQSSFKYIESLNSDPNFSETENKIARAAFTASSDFYYDNLRNIEISQGRDKVLIEKKNAKVAWIISTDSKMIGDYLCYKATYQEPYVSRRSGQKNYTNVVAWFAPMLPYGYGPIQFYGLPGLILELQYKNTTYLATNIKVSSASRTIYSPKGKTVSKEEYDKKLREQMGM